MSQDNSSKALRMLRGSQGSRDSKDTRVSQRWEHKGHARLHRTSVEIQSTYESLYIQRNVSS